MKFSKYIIISFAFLSLSPVKHSPHTLTTNCHQTFNFFFMAQGSPTFWIGEDISGECQGSRLLNISINDSGASISISDLEEYRNWNDIKRLSLIIKKYDQQSIDSINNSWRTKDFIITPPLKDPFFEEEFRQHVLRGGGNAITWFELKGTGGIKLPVIERIEAELLFSYIRGLYINYEISKVYYFPKGYLLVFTKQPLEAVGGDTMHGFFIFRIKNKT